MIKYPNSNSFRWVLRRPLKDILSVELVNGSVPADLYSVNLGWNMFTFQEGTVKWQVALTPGQYTATQLAGELQTQLNALSGVVNIYTVTYINTTKKITVTATGGATYTFLFGTGVYHDDIDGNTGAIMAINSPARLLGFETADYTSSGGAVAAPNRADPDLFLQRLYLYINVDSGHELHRVELGAGRRDCFHVIYMDGVKDGYYSLNKDTYTPVYYSSPAPIARLSVLDISIRDEFFRPIDLGRHDFTLIFEITYLE